MQFASDNKSRSDILAIAGESLTLPVVMWIAAATLIVRDKTAPFPGVWMICVFCAVSMLVFLSVLKKERSITFLAILSAVMFAAALTALLSAYKGSIGFGYVLGAVLIAASAVFGTLNYCVTKQTLSRHISIFDVCVLAVIWVFLNLSVIKISALSLILIIAVLIIDMSGAAALRMSEGGMNEGVGKAFALSAVCSCAAAGVIFLLSMLLSGSGNAVQAVINAVTGFFTVIWHAIEAFFNWLSQFFTYGGPEEVLLPEMSAMEGAQEAVIEETSVDPLIPAVIVSAVLAALVVIIIFRLRKTRIKIKTTAYGSVTVTKTKRKKHAFGAKWCALLKKLIFKKNAFIYRNTPPGVLVWLEKKAKKEKQPRRAGESIREFIGRVAPGKEYEELTSDLERNLYGGRGYALSVSQCRRLKKMQ